MRHYVKAAVRQPARPQVAKLYQQRITLQSLFAFNFHICYWTYCVGALNLMAIL